MGGGEEGQERGDICTIMADLHCMAEVNTTLQKQFSPIKKINLKNSLPKCKEKLHSETWKVSLDSKLVEQKFTTNKQTKTMGVGKEVPREGGYIYTYSWFMLLYRKLT